MPEPEAITIVLDDIDVQKFKRISQDKPFYNQENFVQIAIRNLLSDHIHEPQPEVHARFQEHGWFTNPIRYC